MQAARLLEKGYSQSEVARRVGAHRQSVSQWATELREKGRAGSEAGGPGRAQAQTEREPIAQDRADAQARPRGARLR